MIKCIETSAGTIFTIDGKCTSVRESYDNVMFQLCNNRKPEENEL